MSDDTLLEQLRDQLHATVDLSEILPMWQVFLAYHGISREYESPELSGVNRQALNELVQVDAKLVTFLYEKLCVYIDEPTERLIPLWENDVMLRAAFVRGQYLYTARQIDRFAQPLKGAAASLAKRF